MSKVMPAEGEQVYRLKNAEDDTEGLDASITVENGKLLLNLSKPVQWVSLDSNDAHRMIASLIEAGFAAFAEKGEPIRLN